MNNIMEHGGIRGLLNLDPNEKLGLVTNRYKYTGPDYRIDQLGHSLGSSTDIVPKIQNMLFISEI